MRLDLLAMLSGIMIAVQSRANGELSHQLGNSLQAALISFFSGLIVIAAVAVFNPGMKEGLRNLRSAVQSQQLPRWRLGAGALGGCFVAIQTAVVPTIGVALYAVASIAGQTAISLVVDRIGLTGGGKKLISARRVIAALITVLAVLLSVADRLSESHFALFAVILAVLAGALVGVQRALNGQINEYSKQSFTTALLNFINGVMFLVLAIAAMMVIRGDRLVALPSGPWWIYTGGVIGVIYIAFTSLIVQHLGVLTFTLFSVGGTLVGALMIDIFSPSHGTRVSWFLVSGIAMTYLGVVAGGQSRLFRK